MYTSIDLGSHSIKIVVAKYINDKFYVLASTNVRSLGIKNGIIKDREAVLNCLTEAINKINTDLGINIKNVLLNFPINLINSSIETADIKIDGEVTGKDIQNLMKKCVSENISDNLEVMYVEPIIFDVDRDLHVLDPKGLTASRLEVRCAISTIQKDVLYPYLEVLQSAGLDVSDVTYDVASNYFENSNQEINKKLGVLIDIGYSKTEIAIFNKGILLKGTSILVGSKKIDKDISFVYKIDKKDAVNLKEKFGVASSKYADINDTIEVNNISGEKLVINQLEVSQIIEARLKEILKTVKNEINNLTNREISYIIITGGITNLVGFPYLIDELFKEDKIISNITSLGVRSNIYSSTIGLIKYFNYKMKFRDIDYSMFLDSEIEELTAKKKKVSTRDNLINKFTSYLKN